MIKQISNYKYQMISEDGNNILQATLKIMPKINRGIKFWSVVYSGLSDEYEDAFFRFTNNLMNLEEDRPSYIAWQKIIL